MKVFPFFLLFVFLVGCAKKMTRRVYELPSGYMGWVLVEYQRPGAPALPVVAGRRVIRIGAKGYLATSSVEEFGIASDEYVMVGANPIILHQTLHGGGGEIWGCANARYEVPDRPERLYEVFFVGSENQYKAMAALAPDPGNLPNQSLEPMGIAVTPRADARVAPAIPMAHH